MAAPYSAGNGFKNKCRRRSNVRWLDLKDFISCQSRFEMMTPQLETFSVTLMETTRIKQLYRWTTLFGTFLCRPCTTTTWNFLISRFLGNLNKRRRIYLLFSRFLGNSTSGEFAYVTQNERIGKNTLWVEWVSKVLQISSSHGDFNKLNKACKRAQTWSLGS